MGSNGPSSNCQAGVAELAQWLPLREFRGPVVLFSRRLEILDCHQQSRELQVVHSLSDTRFLLLCVCVFHGACPQVAGRCYHTKVLNEYLLNDGYNGAFITHIVLIQNS